MRRHTSHFSAASPGGERKGAQNSSPPPPGRNVVFSRKNKGVDNIRTSGVEEASSLRRHVKNVRPAGAENVGSPKLPSAGPPKAPYSELQRPTSIRSLHQSPTANFAANSPCFSYVFEIDFFAFDMCHVCLFFIPRFKTAKKTGTKRHSTRYYNPEEAISYHSSGAS